jgi:hypothetical protein
MILPWLTGFVALTGDCRSVSHVGVPGRPGCKSILPARIAGGVMIRSLLLALVLLVASIFHPLDASQRFVCPATALAQPVQLFARRRTRRTRHFPIPSGTAPRRSGRCCVAMDAGARCTFGIRVSTGTTSSCDARDITIKIERPALTLTAVRLDAPISPVLVHDATNTHAEDVRSAIGPSRTFRRRAAGSSPPTTAGRCLPSSSRFPRCCCRSRRASRVNWYLPAHGDFEILKVRRSVSKT